VTSFEQLVVSSEGWLHDFCFRYIHSSLQVVYSLEVRTKLGDYVKLICALFLTPFVRTSPGLASESLTRPKRLKYVSAG
jgi:hypothetical protein